MTEARIMFLSKFQDRPVSQEDINYYESNQGWLEVLGKRPLELRVEYEEDGLIERLNAQDHLEVLMSGLLSVAALKEGLASLGFKKTGKKIELVHRLVSVDREAAIRLLPKGARWGTTKKGGALVDTYRANKQAEQERLEDDLLGMIAKKMYSLASKRRAEYNARQVFPPGLGCSWDNWDTSRDTHILESIRNLTPEALSHRPGETLEPARMLAALSYLLGSKLSSRLYGLIFRQDTSPAKDSRSEASNDARLLVVFAIGKANIEEWKLSSACEFVKVLDAGSDSCRACRAQSKKKYPIGQPPELPNRLCTNPIGCRCCYVPA